MKKNIESTSEAVTASQKSPLMIIMLVRLFFLVGFLLVLAGYTEYDIDLPAFSIFMAITFILAAGYAIGLRKSSSIQKNALYQFTVDIFIITGLIHFTGGISSNLYLLYPLVILVVSIVISGIMAIKVAILAMILYSLLIILEASGFLLYRGIDPVAYQRTSLVVQTGIFQLVLFSLFTLASYYLASRYLFQLVQLVRLQNMARSTISMISIPLLAVQPPQGRIKMANPAACQALGRGEQDLERAFFPELFSDPPPALDQLSTDDDPHRVWSLRRHDGTTFPASFQISGKCLSSAVLNVFQQHAGEGDISLIAFYDMTRILAHEETIRNSEKTHTAAAMISEVAHIVRNPLTAIRGASELINSAVEAALARQHQITEAEFATLKTMCEIIFEQTRELNNKVESFMLFASKEDNRLLDLVEVANVWEARVGGKSKVDDGLTRETAGGD